MFYINLPLLNEIDFKDRFDMQKFVQMSENVYDLLDSYFALKVKELPQYGLTNIQGEEAHPDFLSYRIYGSANFWYILMLYNDYIDVFEMKEGDMIKYPKLEHVEELYFKLNILQKNKTVTGIL